mmetsp:Transcript_18898/g.64366  ORF Transcript_18898/g.64366 Transcript_18898/m.64366 type:complete len:341 (+) Transcript_18898:278-1300(+)
MPLRCDSRLVPWKAPLPGLCTTSSPSAASTSAHSALPGSPRTSVLPLGPAIWPMEGHLLSFAGGQSLRSGRWASRVCTTGTPAARAAASTRAAGPSAARRGATSLPRECPKPPSSRKSRCQSTMTSATPPSGHSNRRGAAASTAPPLAPGGAGPGARGRASSALHAASAVATAPKTPCCMVTILHAASWFPLSVAPVPSVSSRHSYPRSFASRIVVCTHTSVVIPPRMSLLTPQLRRTRSRSVAQNEPFPGLSMTSSPGRGASSGMISQPGSPRTRTRPHGPRDPIPAPACSERHLLFAGRSAREGRWPSRVWITRTPAARHEASTRLRGSMGARVSEMS